MGMLMRAGPRSLNLRDSRLPAQKLRLGPLRRRRRRVSRRHALERERELGGGAGRRLGVDRDGVPVDVLNVVALKVVAGVLGGAGAGEEAGGGDSEVEEADVVRRGAEGTGNQVSGNYKETRDNGGPTRIQQACQPTLGCQRAS